MSLRRFPLFALLVLIAASACAQDEPEVARHLARKHYPAPVPQHIEATGERIGGQAIARGIVEGRAVEFVGGEIIVAVNNIGEGTDPAAYISPVVATYNLTYAEEFYNPISNRPDWYRKAVLRAPTKAFEALQRLEMVRSVRVNHVLRFRY